jgi:hypothetical protein
VPVGSTLPTRAPGPSIDPDHARTYKTDHLGHVGGTAGEDKPGAGVAAMVTSSAGRCGPSSVTACLVAERQRRAAARTTVIDRDPL